MKLLGTDARTLTIIMMALGLEATLWADGGLLRTRQHAGPFIVSIFTAPELHAGTIDVSVLVQSSAGDLLTDAVVDVVLESVTRPIERRQARATAAAASNKLAQTAVVDLPAAGQWTLTVSVHFNNDTASLRCLLPVVPAPSRLSVIWPWLLVPPGVIALFAVHQTLKHQRPSARLPRRSVAKAGFARARTQASRPGSEEVN